MRDATQPDTRSRRSNSQNPAKALREQKDPEWQAALVLALGSRKESANLDTIFALTSNKDLKVQEAALVALGMTATAHPVQGKPGIWNSMPEGLRDRAAEAFMKSAELLVKEGKASEAAKLYTEIYQSKLSRPVRMAGLVGLLMSTGDDAAGKILEILAGADKDARAIAAGIIPDLPSGPLTALAKGMVKLPSESQILVLGTLAERGEKAAKPIALEFAMSKEENIQVAGLTALGRLGDESTVDVLVNHLQAGGAVSAAAKSSLARITGPGVEDRIISALRNQSEPNRRATLIEVVENRDATRAVPLLLEESVKDTPTIRRPAMRALGKLAAPGDVPAMIKALLKASPGSEREEAEKAIASVCARTPEKAKQAESVLALYNAAPPAERLAILPVLGRLGGNQVFEVIKTALASNDPETYQVAVDAISNWPDSDETVETELLTLAQKAEKKSDRAAAMRAYIRVISMPSGIPDKTKLAKFQKALDSAEGDQEKMFVLERLADIKRIETLRIVLPYLDKPALAERACVTTLDLARDRGLRNQNKPEFEEALKKVIATSKEKATLERANRYLQEQRQ